MLAGIIASPSAFSPQGQPAGRDGPAQPGPTEHARPGDIARRSTTRPARDQHPVPAASDIQHPTDDSLSPYFTSWLRQQVVDLYGAGRAFGGGYQIHSSLDLDMQNAAQEIAQSTLSGVSPTASVVVIDNSTGEVKAMVGGNNFETHPFNLATNGHRQPGSSFKPFTLATALEPRDLPQHHATRPNEKIFKVPDSKHEYFDVHNYNDEYFGSSSLYDATLHSDNSVYAELALGRTDRCVQGCGGSPAVRGGTKADRPHRPSRWASRPSSRPTRRWSSARSTRA